MKQITGADLFVKALKEEAVDTLFAYPGGQAIDLFNALYGEKEIDVILPRHEQGLIHAADGYARSTGKVGVCLVTSGPGATNLVTGIATANYDSNDRITGKIEEFAVKAKIIHIDVDAASISRNIDVDVPIVADGTKAICALLEKAKPLNISGWTDEIDRWK